MKDPEFSIIVPCYNAEKVVGRCIASVLAQTYPDYELLLIDDGSVDKTAEICRSFVSDKRVQLISKANGGVSSARNLGIQKSRGKYLVFADADDCLKPRLCEQFREQMRDGVDYCIAGYEEFYPGRQPVSQLPSERVEIFPIASFAEEFKQLYRAGFTNAPWAKCYRRTLINEGFPESITIGEDLLFNLNYLSRCVSVALLNQPVYSYYVPQNSSLTTRWKPEYFLMLREVYQQTGQMVSSLFGADALPMNCVTEKYALDLIALCEKVARTKASGQPSERAVSALAEEYHVSDVLQRIDVASVAGAKVKMEKKLLEQKKYSEFTAFTRLSKFAGDIVKGR